MGTDLRRLNTVLDSIRAHPRNPLLKHLAPLNMFENRVSWAFVLICRMLQSGNNHGLKTIRISKIGVNV